MAIESIDNVLEQLVLSGASKIDWKDGESRAVSGGEWSIDDREDHKLFEDHLHPAVITRMRQLSLIVQWPQPPTKPDPQAQLLVIFDPVSRRIEGMEVWDMDTCTVLLTLLFWPGLKSARKLVIATMNKWHQAIDDGWFEGVA